jgi:hypothetical protein
MGDDVVEYTKEELVKLIVTANTPIPLHNPCDTWRDWMLSGAGGSHRGCIKCAHLAKVRAIKAVEIHRAQNLLKQYAQEHANGK